MPKAAFKLVWDTLKNGNEWSGFVLNRGLKGDYWVYAIISPNYGKNGNLYGYTSMRFGANPQALRIIENIYDEMKNAEKKGIYNDKKITLGINFLTEKLKSLNIDYDSFVKDLQGILEE